MATTKITISFDPSKIEATKPRKSANICDTFEPGNTYVDSEAYKGTRYDSNVEGWGRLPQVEPYASTGVPMSVPLAQFKMAAQGTVDSTTGVSSVTIEVDDYKEVMHYKQLGEDLKSQGFSVSVEEPSKPSTPSVGG